MITATDLTKRFGRFRALDGVSFDVPRGRAVALWGVNGAGKTTAIRCVLGLLRYNGRVTVGGVDAKRHPKHARAMLGYVPQELAFHDEMRVSETMHFYARMRRVTRERIADVLERVELADHRRKRVRELSGGMKQRLALGLTLLADPPVLVLDEPTSNLDAGARTDFVALLREQKREGKTILFTSHRIDEIEALADSVVALERGRRATECRPDQLVDTLGVRCVLQVFIPTERLDDAVAALRAVGYDASRNGAAVYIDAPANRKAAPIIALGDARIPVDNFECLSEDRATTRRSSLHA